MFPDLGIDRRLMKNPAWINAQTGQVVRTGARHHAGVFKSNPALLGFSPEDIASRFTNGDDWTLDNVLTTQIIRDGWCRIDELGPSDICIIAGDLSLAEAAHSALRVTGFDDRPAQLTIFIIPTAFYTSDQIQLIKLQGADVERARLEGLSRWARPEIEAAARPSKMAGAEQPGIGKVRAKPARTSTPIDHARTMVVRRCPFSPAP